jgi:mannitol/fructose-specific phosphotransferase system IIA component (Ntr-type)
MSVLAASPLPDTSLCIPDFRSRTRDSALTEIVARLGVCVRDPQLLRESLLRREKYGSTDLGRGVALPNARSLAVSAVCCVLARSVKGVTWDDEKHPVLLVCAVISPAEWSEEMHHDVLLRVSAPLRLQRPRQKLADVDAGPSMLALWRELIA